MLQQKTEMKPKKGFRGWAHKARLASQLTFFVLFVVLISGAICVYSGAKISALEPLGLVQLLVSEIRTGSLNMPPLAIAGSIAFVAAFVIFGGAFCGWACPVGTVADLVGRLRRQPEEIKPKEKKVEGFFANIPTRETIALSVVGASFATGSPAWCPICPIGGICRGIGLNGLVGGVEVVAFAAVPAIAEGKSPRWFCKHVCPVGGTISFLRKYFSPFFKLQVNPKTCAKCDLCFFNCPMDAKVYEGKDQSKCIMCLKCYQACPYNEKGIQIKVKGW